MAGMLNAPVPAPASIPGSATTSTTTHEGKDGCAACAVYDILTAHFGKDEADWTVKVLLHKRYWVALPNSGGGTPLDFFTSDEVNAPAYREKLRELIDRFRSELPHTQAAWKESKGNIPSMINMRVREVIERATLAEGRLEDAIAAAAPRSKEAVAEPLKCAVCDKDITTFEAQSMGGTTYACEECYNDVIQNLNQEGGSRRHRNRSHRSRRNRSRRSKFHRSKSRRNRSRRNRSRQNRK